MKSSTQDKAQGTAKTMVGSSKDITGKLLGNQRLQAAGKMEKIEGQAQKEVGKIKKVVGN
jgi:uncharacterized protein YjbJ (UPF0337 family)